MHEIQMLGLLDHDVLSSIEVPYLPEQYASLLDPAREGNFEAFVAAKREADKFDTEIFEYNDLEALAPSSNRTSGLSITGGTPMPSSIRIMDKRAPAQHRTSQPPSNIHRIEESPHPSEGEPLSTPAVEKRLTVGSLSGASAGNLSTSPSQASIRSARSTHSTRSNASTSSAQGNRSPQSGSASLLRSKFAPSWLFNPFRSGPSQAETSPVSASGESTPILSVHRSSKALLPTPLTTTDKKAPALPSQPHARSPLATTTDISSSPRPMPIKGIGSSRLSRTFDDGGQIVPGSLTKHSQSPMNTPPRDDTVFEKRRSIVLGSSAYLLTSSSPSVRPTPSGPPIPVSYTDSSLARRWQHMFPQPGFKHDIKWKSMVTPGCLPLTTEAFPSTSELETSYDVFSYDFVVDPPETRSFLVRPPTVQSQNPDEVRRLWALVVMRGMIALRLAQGFQIVLRPANSPDNDPNLDPRALRRTKSYVSDEDATPRPIGAAAALHAQADPVYLSMSNEIHRIAYTGEGIQVRRYVRRMPPTPPLNYKCLIWPKLGVGYTELSLSFAYHGLENYGWNR
jgi:DEP domain-containing protein 5